jgi:hypothetical protein
VASPTPPVPRPSANRSSLRPFVVPGPAVDPVPSRLDSPTDRIDDRRQPPRAGSAVVRSETRPGGALAHSTRSTVPLAHLVPALLVAPGPPARRRDPPCVDYPCVVGRDPASAWIDFTRLIGPLPGHPLGRVEPWTDGGRRGRGRRSVDGKVDRGRESGPWTGGWTVDGRGATAARRRPSPDRPRTVRPGTTGPRIRDRGAAPDALSGPLLPVRRQFEPV